jgi:hypothetical protein
MLVYGKEVKDIDPKDNVTAKRRKAAKKRRYIVIAIMALLSFTMMPDLSDMGANVWSDVKYFSIKQADTAAARLSQWQLGIERRYQDWQKRQFKEHLAGIRDPDSRNVRTWHNSWKPIDMIKSVAMTEIRDKVGGPQADYTEAVYSLDIRDFSIFAIKRRLVARQYLFTEYDLDYLEIEMHGELILLNQTFFWLPIYWQQGIRPGSPEWEDLAHLAVNGKRFKKKITATK